MSLICSCGTPLCCDNDKLLGYALLIIELAGGCPPPENMDPSRSGCAKPPRGPGGATKSDGGGGSTMGKRP